MWMMQLFLRTVWLLGSLLISLPSVAASTPGSILLLLPSDVRGPFYNELFSALRSAVNARAGAPVTIYVENLDMSRFTGPVYEQSLRDHLEVKYHDKPIGVL